MRLETLFLDAGGVLVNPNWERVADALRRRGIGIEAATLAEAEPHAKRTFDSPRHAGASTEDTRGWLYFNLVLGRAGIPLSDATDAALAEMREYHRRSNLWESVPDEVRPALRRLRDAGLRLVVVSNANGTLRAHLDRLGLTPLVDAVFDSHDEGVEKPDPRFFEIALERGGARRESTVHVGDLYRIDVMGARAARLGAVLFDAADLYPEADCPRVRSLLALADRIEAGSL